MQTTLYHLQETAISLYYCNHVCLDYQFEFNKLTTDLYWSTQIYTQTSSTQSIRHDKKHDN